ncbi:hypothetical protein MC885_015057, partial [Smutsia gigantea]
FLPTPSTDFRKNLPTRSWLLLRHCSGPLGSAIPLGQPLSKHLCLEDFELGPFLCLERGMMCQVKLLQSLGNWDEKGALDFRYGSVTFFKLTIKTLSAQPCQHVLFALPGGLLGIVKLITWKATKVKYQSDLGVVAEADRGGKKIPTNNSRKLEPAHRFDTLNVKSTGCHICGHKDVNLFILKAPGNSHKQMFMCIPNPIAPQETDPAFAVKQQHTDYHSETIRHLHAPLIIP